MHDIKGITVNVQNGPYVFLFDVSYSHNRLCFHTLRGVKKKMGWAYIESLTWQILKCQIRTGFFIPLLKLTN